MKDVRELCEFSFAQMDVSLHFEEGILQVRGDYDWLVLSFDALAFCFPSTKVIWQHVPFLHSSEQLLKTVTYPPPNNTMERKQNAAITSTINGQKKLQQLSQLLTDGIQMEAVLMYVLILIWVDFILPPDVFRTSLQPCHQYHLHQTALFVQPPLLLKSSTQPAIIDYNGMQLRTCWCAKSVHFLQSKLKIGHRGFH